MNCSTCNMRIEKSQARSHYQSDFHTENIKRKAVGAPVLAEGEWRARMQLESVGQQSGEEQQEHSACAGAYAPAPSECLFCPAILDGAREDYLVSEAYLAHLGTHHFRFSNEHWLRDKLGLMEHLREKIARCMCTYCGRRFRSIEGARAHMEALGHARYTDTDEFEEFYSYPPPQTLRVSEDGVELILPSGKTAGSRLYSRYYAQCLREPGYYEALGGAGKQVICREQEKLPRSAALSAEREALRRSRSDLKVSTRANFQKHFREDWMQ